VCRATRRCVVRRLLLGGLFGALLGGALGAGYSFAFRTPMTPNASLLMAIAVGILVAGLLRRAPWRQESAVETVLRALLGALLGAGLGFLARRSIDVALPFALPPMPAEATFVEHAWLFPTAIGAVIGALVRAFGPEPTPAATAKPTPAEPKRAVSERTETSSRPGT